MGRTGGSGQIRCVLVLGAEMGGKGDPLPPPPPPQLREKVVQTGGLVHTSLHLQWYLFNEDQLLPEYVLHVQAREDTRTAADDM